MRPSSRPLLLGFVLAGLLAGCSSGEGDAPAGPQLPQVDAFAPGTCRTAAPDVIAVGQALPRLGGGGVVDAQVKDGLRDAQRRLVSVRDKAGPAYAPAFEDLVGSIGIVRIRADGNTYEPQFGKTLKASYERVVALCTAPGSQSPDPAGSPAP